MILDCFWVSGVDDSLRLLNIIENILYYLDELIRGGELGLYIVNGESELIFINLKLKIRKLLKDMKKIIIFIERVDFIWVLLCVYWFLYIVDLFVGMYRKELRDDIDNFDDIDDKDLMELIVVGIGKVIWYK